MGAKITAWAALGVYSVMAFAQDAQAKKATLKDIDVVGSWVYDDINAGYALAKKESKPMLVVFR